MFWPHQCKLSFLADGVKDLTIYCFKIICRLSINQFDDVILLYGLTVRAKVVMIR